MIRIPVLLAALMAFPFSGIVSAQTQTQTPAKLASTPDPLPTRDQLYKDLKVQAVALEQHYQLIKQIFRTVKPTVAHIEARKRKSDSTDGSKNRGIMIEEAGAGIVIQYRGRPYVITNFHVIENSAINDIRIESDGILYYPTRATHDLSLIHI